MKTRFKLFGVLGVLLLLGVVAWGCSSPTTTSETDAISVLTTQITKMQTDLNTLAATIAKLPTTDAITSTVNTVATPLGARISALETSLTDVKAQLVSINASRAQADVATGKIADMQTQLTALNNAIIDLQTTVKKLTDTEVADAAAIAALKASMTSTTTTTPTTTSTTVSANAVVASIGGNVFTGSSVLSFNAFSAAGTATQSLSYKITNNSGKTLSGIQIALALESIDVSGLPVSYSSVISVTLASTNLAFTWTSQSTGLAYLKGWVASTSNTGFLGQIGSFSQGPGVVTYTLTVTVTATDVAAAINLLPVIQVISFATQ